MGKARAVTCSRLVVAGPHLGQQSEVMVVLSGIGPGVVRAAAVIPATLIVLFVGLLWVAGLACGASRREYVRVISGQAMRAVEVLMGAPAGPPPRAGVRAVERRGAGRADVG